MTDSSVLAELNTQVWEPFRAAYAAGDAAGYLALHDPALIRAGGPGRRVQSYRSDVVHGRFHTFCRRADGRWRIAVDYDTNEGADETTFAAAAAPDDLIPFATASGN